MIKNIFKKIFTILNRIIYTSRCLKRNEEAVIVKFSNSTETSKNWGDALNPYLIKKISKKNVLHRESFLNPFKMEVYSVIGSVLDNNPYSELQVWGSGFKKDPGTINVKPKKIWAVRGRLTRDIFLRNNVDCPEIYGDPGILISDYYKPQIFDARKYKLGIIPHYVDKKYTFLQEFDNNVVKIIDIEQGIESFIDEVIDCERIASSSLHGLICAASYGIPYCWIKISDGISGGNFKFYDYFSSFLSDDEFPDPFLLNTKISYDLIINTGFWLTKGPAKGPLYESCPLIK